MSIIIEEVTLENFKSYAEETTISLGRGVTAILGDNGSGKSTIQEAVGYALFDTHPFRNQGRLVRDGANSGHVEVTFTLPETGETYTVRRWAGRSKYDVLDENGDFLGLDGTTGVKDWLCGRLDIDDPDDLSEVWERSVGVPQTSFLSDFTKTEAERIDTFDPLFDIERYRDAYKDLGGLDEEFDDEIDGLENEITRLDAKLEDLPEVEDEVEEHEAAVEDLQEEIDDFSEEIDDLEDEEADLEALEEELRDAKQELERLEEDKIPAQKQTLEHAKEQCDEAEEAKETLEAVEEEHERHQAAQDRLDELEDDRDERDDLKDQLTEIGSDIDLARERVERLKADRREAERARNRLEELEPKKERYEALDEEINELREKENRIGTIDDRLGEIESDIEELRDDAEDFRKEIEAAEDRREEADRLPDLRNERQELVAEKQNLESERQELEAQNEELRSIEIGDASEVACPTCDQPVTADHREHVIENNEDRLEEITSEDFPAVEEKIREAENAIEAAEDAKDAVDQIPRLEVDLEDVMDEIEGLRKEKQDLDAEQEDLQDDVADLPEKEEERDDLDGVVDDYHTAKATVDNADDVPEKLRDARDELGKHLVEYRRVQSDLSEFDGLDDDIAEAKAVIDETQEAHTTYIKNEDTADALPERREAVGDEREELEGLQEERDDAEADVERLQSQFDAERLSDVQEELAKLNDKRSQAKGKLETAKSDLEEAQDELADLEEKRDRKQSLEAEVIEVERDQEFARWVRNSLQQGAEDLRDLITSELGDRANTIYQQLRGNPTETLVWDKTYNLRVRVRGQNKPFDTLSGGEKMAAALAVRLAILEQLASVGIAFLDEPTANLDRHKKQNLVNELEELDELNQLFVVSHDRTFESMTERTVELEKDEDREVTQVVSE